MGFVIVHDWSFVAEQNINTEIGDGYPQKDVDVSVRTKGVMTRLGGKESRW